jgi:hypothetical protein
VDDCFRAHRSWKIEAAEKGLISIKNTRKTSNLDSKAAKEGEFRSDPESATWDNVALIRLALCWGQGLSFSAVFEWPDLFLLSAGVKQASGKGLISEELVQMGSRRG